MTLILTSYLVTQKSVFNYQLKIEDMPCSAANLRWDLNIGIYIMTDLHSWKWIADSKMPLIQIME